MKTWSLSILFLVLLPCALGARDGTAVRKGDIIGLSLAGVPHDESAFFNATPYHLVDAHGMIDLPYIGGIKIAGFLPVEIKKAIEDRYTGQKIYAHPSITVEQNVGEVFVYVYTLDTMQGGHRVELQRSGKTTIYDMTDIWKGKTGNPKVLPGDRITTSLSLKVEGRGARIIWEPGLTLIGVIVCCGGYSDY